MLGARGRSAYRASKAALISFTESLAAEVHAHGIAVNGICLGAVATELFTSVFESEVKMMDPAEIADVAHFLASDSSRAVTGTCLDAFGPANPVFG